MVIIGKHYYISTNCKGVEIMKCAVYIRVSTDKEEQKTSLVNQQKFFYDTIAEKGWGLYKFYVDVESGTKTKNREKLKQLIDDAKNRRFDVILSKELSRLARNGKLSYEIKDLAEKNHIHIITFDNAINSIDGNIHMFGLYAWLYEQESQRTSERIKAALNTRAKGGDFIGSNPPYGYITINKKLHLADDYRPTEVKKIFELYLKGMGFGSIAKTLFKEGYPSPSQVAGKKNASQFWYDTAIRYILTNPHYVGDLVQGRETTRSVTSELRQAIPKKKHIVIKDNHPAIISRDDFKTVQELIRSRKTNITKGNKHLFTNVLYCSDCNSGMWYMQNRKGYVCGRYARHGKIACTQRTVKEQKLKNIIINDIQQVANLINNPEKLKDIITKEKENININNKQLSILERESSRLKARKKKYLELLADELISHDEYRESADELQKSITAIDVKKSERLASLQFNNFIEMSKSLNRSIKKFSPIENITKEMIYYFIERIDVNTDGIPKITYRFSILNN